MQEHAKMKDAIKGLEQARMQAANKKKAFIHRNRGVFNAINQKKRRAAMLSQWTGKIVKPELSAREKQYLHLAARYTRHIQQIEVNLANLQ